MARFVSVKTVEQRLFDNSERIDNGCRLWLKYVRPNGYAYITLRNPRRTISVHRLAWQLANCREVPLGLCVCHSCDVPTCIEPGHLFLGTKAENNTDRARKGRSHDAKGEGNNSAKLTSEQVTAIRLDSRGAGPLSKLYGISRSQAYRIKRGLRWKHV
jgi:hypothetical protein